ncbi:MULTISPECIES: trypsin-like serine protease [Streptomyces]|uniref:trypsin-like serine protease n=1 Tax=Streptomyces TaxID=1883 RepID=UPI0003A480A2|nr:MULTISPECIES: trypsin-like serine protease [Streptomyces]MBZ6112174.1 S1 family peptidase [Streptomyces olivaceus]MBZ6125699.1 S1 family peptidase [Streptomyces olivaceus]MBZ6147001.1 S1 family peptidase [Streptomyces olivaceus]MBZ6159442.1 S1 family peptidase [Streptomyces olivaceus]MBZ6188172.1 S1 family peptidase [Streptomyces olivaceus]
MPHNRSRHVRLTALAAALLAGPLALTAGPAAAVTGPAVPDSDTTRAYTAQIVVGDHDRGCSGVLVDAEWLLTAASCFAENPVESLAVPAGKPALTTTATIGRADLTGTGGAVRTVVELVPRTDRDAVLARLNRPVTDVTPVALATAAPTAGEKLTLSGYGRTKTEWAPLNLHTGTFSVGAADATTATVTGEDGVAACMGDTGGPLVRTVNGGAQLAALGSRSYQAGCYGIDAAETRTDGIVTRVDDLGSWVASKVGAGRITDFNCDGVEDIAVADPLATVGGDAKAGLVRIVYGGGRGTAEISQDLDWVPGGSEPDDQFGAALATVDYDEDGCTDLVVGTPRENLGSATDAGMVDILHGGRDGLGTSATKFTHFEQAKGNGSLSASTPETGDLMGASLAAGTTAAGKPFVVIGTPGESLGSLAAAGEAFYVHDGTNVTLHQDRADTPGTAEAGDRFSESVAADANHIAIGVPGEAIGTDAEAGGVTVYSHALNAEKRPTPLFGMDQDLDTVSGGSEPGDLFGASVALAPYRPAGSAKADESLLAIGSPGEALNVNGVSKAETGSVLTFRVTANGTFTQLNGISSGTGDDDVSGTSEAGDHFGATVTAINTAPREVGTEATMKMAVGIPDEAIGTAKSSGAVHVFSMLGSPGANDKWIESGDGDGIPGAPGAGQRLGSSIHFTGTHLYVGMPYGPTSTGALYALPMSNVTLGEPNAEPTVYQPGQGGLPSSGTAFGYAAR